MDINKVVLALSVFSFFFSGRLDGQITVSPEIGVSYWPLSLETLNSGERTSNRIDYLVGISGAVPLHEVWYLHMRLSYSNREDFRWGDLTFCPGYEYSEYTHNDLNIDFHIRHQAFNKVSWMVGPSIVRKINSTTSIHYKVGAPCESSIRRADRFIYGFFLASGINIKELIVKIEYTHLFWRDPDLRPYRSISGRHRCNLVLSYPILKGKTR